MTGLLIGDWNGNKLGVEISFSHNEAIPTLLFNVWDAEDFQEMDAQALFELMKIGEANTNAIWQFDQKYDWDCMAQFNEDIFIEKYCCSEEEDKPYIVELPKVQECVGICNNCPLCNYSPSKYECRFDELYPRDGEF